MRDVKPASELRDRVPCPLPGTRPPLARRFTPTTELLLAPDLWGETTRLSGFDLIYHGRWTPSMMMFLEGIPHC